MWAHFVTVQAHFKPRHFDKNRSVPSSVAFVAWTERVRLSKVRGMLLNILTLLVTVCLELQLASLLPTSGCSDQANVLCSFICATYTEGLHLRGNQCVTCVNNFCCQSREQNDCNKSSNHLGICHTRGRFTNCWSLLLLHQPMLLHIFLNNRCWSLFCPFSWGSFD